MLSTSRGHALFIGTPKGFDHFRDAYLLGQFGGDPSYRSFLFTTEEGGNVPREEIEAADAVVMNYTLQFVAPALRQGLLQRIHAGLKSSGVLIVSEKIRFDDPLLQTEFEAAHLDFKRANGYSELEISQKRSALENVMKPDTLPEHQQRLQQAGFTSQTLWFQCFNFCSMVAIK